MWNRRFHRSVLCYFLLLTFTSPPINGTLAEIGINQNGWLITPEEAAMAPAIEDGEKSRELMGADGPNLGPVIEVITPKEGDRAAAPIEVNIKFTPRTNPVNIKSLEVSVLKFITIDITDRVRDYSSPEGIHVKEAKIPQGKHTVRISIADINGLYSYKETSFEVT